MTENQIAPDLRIRLYAGMVLTRKFEERIAALSQEPNRMPGEVPAGDIRTPLGDAPRIPVPAAPTHEKIFKPGPQDVVLAVREAMG